MGGSKPRRAFEARIRVLFVSFPKRAERAARLRCHIKAVSASFVETQATSLLEPHSLAASSLSLTSFWAEKLNVTQGARLGLPTNPGLLKLDGQRRFSRANDFSPGLRKGMTLVRSALPSRS